MPVVKKKSKMKLGKKEPVRKLVPIRHKTNGSISNCEENDVVFLVNNGWERIGHDAP